MTVQVRRSKAKGGLDNAREQVVKQRIAGTVREDLAGEQVMGLL